MLKFKPGDRVVCRRVQGKSGYDYTNHLGHGAIVTEDRSSQYGGFVGVVWDKPSRWADGGYDANVFDLEGGPW